MGRPNNVQPSRRVANNCSIYYLLNATDFAYLFSGLFLLIIITNVVVYVAWQMHLQLANPELTVETSNDDIDKILVETPHQFNSILPPSAKKAHGGQ